MMNMKEDGVGDAELTMDVAVCTYAPQGIERVAAQGLPQVEGVRYVVSWQGHEGAPVPAELASRPDVEVHRLDARGLANNRNNALAHCRADIVLHADDDVIYDVEGLRQVMQIMSRHPEVAVGTFRADMPANRILPSESVPLGDPLPRGYYAASIEMAVRRNAVGDLRFCPEMGIGAGRYEIGEDSMYLHTAIRRGLACRYFPVTICRHPHESTGNRVMTRGNLRGTGCCIALMYPWTSPLRIVLKAWRLSRSGQSGFWRSLRYLASGWAGAPGVRRRNPELS